MVEELKRYPYTSLLDKNICDVFLFWIAWLGMFFSYWS
jgi:hypothetical protein